MRNNNWALVTGASSGIGKEFCELLAKDRWNLVIVARREDLLSEIKNDLHTRYGIEVEICKADLANPDELGHVAQQLEKFGVRLLINNAGILSRGDFAKKDLQQSDAVIDLNVVSLVHLTHAAINHFKKIGTECYILNVGSLNSFISTGDQAVYCASKAFVKSFTLALADELRGTQIKISCLCPGGTKTQIMDVAGVSVSDEGQRFMMDPRVVAGVGLSAVRNGRLLVIPGGFNMLAALFARLIPEFMMTTLASKALRTAVKEKYSIPG